MSKGWLNNWEDEQESRYEVPVRAPATFARHDRETAVPAPASGRAWETTPEPCSACRRLRFKTSSCPHCGARA